MYMILQILALVAAIWVIYDVWSSSKDTGTKVLWTVLALFFSLIRLNNINQNLNLGVR